MRIIFKKSVSVLVKHYLQQFGIPEQVVQENKHRLFQV